MARFNKKNKYQFWHSPLVLIALFLIVVLFSYNLVSLIRKERETSKNKASELAKIDSLRKQNSELSQQLDKLNTSEGVEESIRDKFQVVKPGEKMVVIVNNDNKEPNSSDSTSGNSFWDSIKRFFGFSK